MAGIKPKIEERASAATSIIVVSHKKKCCGFTITQGGERMQHHYSSFVEPRSAKHHPERVAEEEIKMGMST